MIKSLFKCMYSHRLLVVGMILAPKSRCSVPGSFEDETLLICIIYIQEKLHLSIPNADTGLPWCTWCWNFSLVYSFNIKLQVSGSSFTVSLTRRRPFFDEFPKAKIDRMKGLEVVSSQDWFISFEDGLLHRECSLLGGHHLIIRFLPE